MIRIAMDRDPPRYQPGETLRGTIQWSGLPDQTTSLEARLVWYTRGKGNQDVRTIRIEKLSGGPGEGSATVDFVAPTEPYSFSGKLISLIWCLEVVALPQGDAERVELVIAPGAREVQLYVETQGAPA